MLLTFKQAARVLQVSAKELKRQLPSFVFVHGLIDKDSLYIWMRQQRLPITDAEFAERVFREDGR